MTSALDGCGLYASKNNSYRISQHGQGQSCHAADADRKKVSIGYCGILRHRDGVPGDLPHPGQSEGSVPGAWDLLCGTSSEGIVSVLYAGKAGKETGRHRLQDRLFLVRPRQMPMGHPAQVSRRRSRHSGNHLTVTASTMLVLPQTSRNALGKNNLHRSCCPWLTGV